jgi:hypothetical protein
MLINKKNNMWQYPLMIAVGSLLLIIAFFTLKGSLSFIHASERAMGTVIALKIHDHADGKFYSPIFAFRTKSNQE